MHCETLPAYYLGCPVWNASGWENEVYPVGTPKTRYLFHYTRTFSTVEGNSTFYGLPREASVKRWVEESAAGFQFCFKFPRVISHDHELSNASEPTREFLERLTPLHDAGRLGPTFLQLGPQFSPRKFDVLTKYLSSLPSSWRFAVEVRHLDWFDQGENEHRLDAWLERYGIDKVIFDSRPLFQAEPDDEIEVKSQSRKPRTPLRDTVTGEHPMLRIVGRNQIEMADRFFAQWAPKIRSWIAAGKTPFIFTHAPDDVRAPALARRMHDAICGVAPPKQWPMAFPPTKIDSAPHQNPGESQNGAGQGTLF